MLTKERHDQIWAMIFLAVLLFAAAFGAYSGRGGLTSQYPSQIVPAAPSGEPKVQQDRADEPQPTEEQQAQAANYRSPCDQPRRREDADLCQQWRMAKAAEDQVIWSSRLFYVAIVDGFLLVMTVLFTGAATLIAARSARISMRAALAAERSVEVASDTAQRELRAYVSAEPDPRRIEGFMPNLQAFVVGVTMINHGLTPARDVRFQGAIDVLPFPLPNGFRFPARNMPPTNASLFPNRILPIAGPAEFARPLSEEELIGALTVGSNTLVYVYGRIDYKDVFGNDWHTEYAAAIRTHPNIVPFLRGQPVKPVIQFVNIPEYCSST